MIRRRAFLIATAISLVLCVASAMFWVSGRGDRMHYWSRSAATVLAWIVCRRGMELSEAAEVLSSRMLTNPDPAFLRQLGRHRGVVIGEEEPRRLVQCGSR